MGGFTDRGWAFRLLIFCLISLVLIILLPFMLGNDLLVVLVFSGGLLVLILWGIGSTLLHFLRPRKGVEDKEEMARAMEAGLILAGGSCPHCKEHTDTDQEKCEHCGGNLKRIGNILISIGDNRTIKLSPISEPTAAKPHPDN